MSPRRTARELERDAAGAPMPRHDPSPLPSGEAVRMLARRGIRTSAKPLDLPFPPDLDEASYDRITVELGHYAFRLFLRGAIQKADGFHPGEATRYLKPAQALKTAEKLVHLGLAERLDDGRYRLVQPAESFGATLEWYVARELGRRFGFDVAMALKLRVTGVGGDLDVVAAAEGKLVYLEVKSSPPKNLLDSEVTAFFDRLRALRPDVALLVIDTALRLSDKVIPMLTAELARRQAPCEPRRLWNELWALTPHVYAVNADRDLMTNVGRAIAEGLRALAPDPP